MTIEQILQILNQILNVLVTLTLIEMMVTIGLGVALADVAAVARNWRLIGRAALANYVCVPAAALGLLLLFHSDPLVSAGFLIVAVCPGAPYGPPFTGIARGNVPVSVGLMVILAASSALMAPLLLSILLPRMGGDESLHVDAVKMIVTLLVTQLLPLSAGLALRRWRPALADRLMRPAKLLGTVLNLVVFGSILVLQFGMLKEIRLLAFAGMLALIGASVVAGWLLGGPGSSNRTAMVMATSVRNVGVSLVIVTSSFPGTAAVTAATAFAIFQTIIMALVALGWGRLTPAPPK
jgi:BASS family bile acid:Na+ symporter